MMKTVVGTVVKGNKALQVAHLGTSALAFGVSQLGDSLAVLAEKYEKRMKEEFGLDITIVIEKHTDMFGRRLGGYAFTKVGKKDTLYLNFDSQLEFDGIVSILKMSRSAAFEAIMSHEMGHIEAMLNGDLTCNHDYMGSRENVLHQEKLAWTYGKKYCRKKYIWAFHVFNVCSYGEYKLHKAKSISL